MKQNENASHEEGQSAKKLTNGRIINKITNYAILFRDQNNDPFIAPNGDGTKILRIGAKNREFRTWLTNLIHKEYHEVPNIRRIENIAQMLESIALDTELSSQYTLELRTMLKQETTTDGIAKIELYYDLGESAVRITPEGWSIIARPEIMFRRFSQQLPQVMPEKGGNLLELAKFINLDNKDDILLFLVFAVSAFIPGYPRPLCLLYGTQGSGKSTPGRLLKRLIDPTSVEGTVLPTNHEDFVRIASHHALLVFDNISSIKPNISDSLARLSTGDTFSKRALFTDDDDVVFRLQRPVMLNGINQVITQSDLLDRSILLEMHRIDKSKIRTEKDFWEDFDRQKPLILGAIFDVIANAMKKLPTISTTSLPRMADFAKWGCAIASSIDGYEGKDFAQAYVDNVKRQHEQAIESSTVGTAVYLFMTYHGVAKDKWSGTATQLVEQIKKIEDNPNCSDDLRDEIRALTDSSLWPKDPSWFMRKLSYVLPDLEAQGIRINTYCKNNRRNIDIENLRYQEEKSE